MSSSMEPLHTKYRPRTFDEVVGQDTVVRSLRRAVEGRASRTFLLTGPSGTGKTTLARIAAAALGCAPADIEEIDAATHTGVDDMRAVTAQLMYRPLGGTTKALILDEAHRLSRQAWESLLKILEEPPDFVVWFICTTDPAKVPKTVVTRCFPCELKPVAFSVMEDLLTEIAGEEGLCDGPQGEKVIQLCARQAEGSPRQALVYLAACASAKTVQEARELLRSAEESAEAVDLARLLVRGASWSEVQAVLAKMGDVSPESVRHVVRAYVSKVVLNARGEDDAGRGIEILDAFSEPCGQGEGIAPLLVACGRAVLGTED
jgi:DNA polymerase III subunit gamma/tau